MNTKNSQDAGQQGLILPKRAVPFVWAVIVLIIQVLLPWALARIGSHYGWRDSRPASWNLLGLLAVLSGLGLYAWSLVFHYLSYQTSVKVSFTPPHLVTGGPYQVSRNPMYASGMFTWLGWAVFFGSPAVAFGLILFWAVFTWRVIPSEERLLEGQFGSEYLDYKQTVRRWIGRF